MTDKNNITITEDDLLASIDDTDNITISGWNSPLSTTLSTMYPSSTLGTTLGTTGATLTTSGTGNLLWNNTVWTNGTINNTPTIMKVDCDAEFNGEVKIRGVKLDERLNTIEERLGILRPNNDLEGKWEKLKALGEEYRKLEREILEGEAIWNALKK